MGADRPHSNRAASRVAYIVRWHSSVLECDKTAAFEKRLAAESFAATHTLADGTPCIVEPTIISQATAVRWGWIQAPRNVDDLRGLNRLRGVK